MRIPVLIFLLLVFAVPVDAVALKTGSGAYEFQAPDLLRIVIEGEVSGSDARSFRFSADGSGNADGVVNASEARAAEDRFVNAFKMYGREIGPPGGRIFVDGKDLKSIQVELAEFSDAEGASNSSVTIRTHTVYRVNFSIEDRANHTVRIDPRRPDRGAWHTTNITEALLVAPSGFRFDPTLGFPSGASLSSGRDRMTLASGFGTEKPVEVTLVQSREDAGSSTMGLMLLTSMGLVIAIGCFQRLGRS